MFSWSQQNVTDLFWLNLNGEVRKGILGLPTSYNFQTKTWKQAHTQGAWVITQWILRNQKTNIIQVKVDDDKQDFKILIDKKNLLTEAHDLVSKLLLTLETYKATGATEKAKALYDDLSKVSDDWLVVDQIIRSKRQPAHLRVFNNLDKPHEETILEQYHLAGIKQKLSNSLVERVVDNKVTAEMIEEEKELPAPSVVGYSESMESVIYSYASRYPFNADFYKTTMWEWMPHKDDLRVGENVEASY